MWLVFATKIASEDNSENILLTLSKSIFPFAFFFMGFFDNARAADEYNPMMDTFDFLVTTITPIIIAWLFGLSKKYEDQIKENKDHIKEYEGHEDQIREYEDRIKRCE